jgi:hypothetical protein
LPRPRQAGSQCDGYPVMAVTVLEPELATNTVPYAPSLGSTAMPPGLVPTMTVAMVWGVRVLAPLMISTVPLPLLGMSATYAVSVLALTATALTVLPGGVVSVFRFVIGGVLTSV